MNLCNKAFEWMLPILHIHKQISVLTSWDSDQEMNTTLVEKLRIILIHLQWLYITDEIEGISLSRHLDTAYKVECLTNVVGDVDQ